MDYYAYKMKYYSEVEISFVIEVDQFGNEFLNDDSIEFRFNDIEFIPVKLHLLKSFIMSNQDSWELVV